MARMHTTTLTAADGDLQVHTDVTGRAARMGHRLTLSVGSWRAEVDWSDDEPTAVRLTAETASLAVEHGEGGLTPLSGAERALARSNALKTLSTQRFPTVSFETLEVTTIPEGYRLSGDLHIHGHRRAHSVDVQVSDTGTGWTLSARTPVRQTDFGLTPYSMFMGSLKVADTVIVTLSATYRDEDRVRV
ncbi:YceI family protein [Mycobacterium sp. WMMD1722]|uniref:YceI family protein n=1 Tax=Mycobacterium sp. WMMD1722 TaxID=3404117 RepID=UPI003BF51797